jgi:hypothetical protein
MDALAWVLLCHKLEVADKSLLSIFDHRMVLGIAIANIPFDGFARTALVEHQIVEGLSCFLVLFRVQIFRSCSQLLDDAINSSSGLEAGPRP